MTEGAAGMIEGAGMTEGVGMMGNGGNDRNGRGSRQKLLKPGHDCCQRE